MIATHEALLIVLLFVVPGAAYTWSFERNAGSFGATANDRVLRFIAASAAVHLTLGWLEYIAWRHSLADGNALLTGDFAILWGGALVIAGLPTAVGWALAALWTSRNRRQAHRGLRRLLRLSGEKGARREERLLRVALGRSPAPRAWDHLFSANPHGLVRAQFKSDGSWVGGLFRADSYAAGYPEDPQDVYLELAYALDAAGNFMREDGEPREIGSGILLRWEDLRIVEFFHD